MDDENMDECDWLVCPDKLLGEGTWSRVYYATHTRSGCHAACKVMLKTTDENVRLARTEIEFLLWLKHPNIIKLYSVINKPDRYEIFLEYFSEGDLFARMDKTEDNRLPEKDAKHITRQLVSALRFLHSKDVVHRDVKADNVLMKGDRTVLCDFGLSTRLASSTTYLTNWVGSPLYASPELTRRIPYRKGPDVWALGVLIYIICTGDIPFDEITSKDAKIAAFDFTKPAKYDRDGITPDCEELLRMMIVTEERKRATIDDVLVHKWLL